MKTAGNRKLVVFSLGNSISNANSIIDVKVVSSITSQFEKLLESGTGSGMQIVAVVGAGGLGRDYTKFARQQIGKRADYNTIEIEASRVNALFLASSIYKRGVVTNLTVPETWVEFEIYHTSKNYECVVIGGIERGMTCDSTAAAIACRESAAFVIISPGGGILAGKHDWDYSIGGKKIRQRIDRPYLRRVMTSRGENVLDPRTCKILLDKEKGEVNAIVTGYANILAATRALLSSKDRRSAIESATRIMV